MAQHTQQPNSDPMAIVVIPIALIFLVIMFWVMNGEGIYYGSGKMAYWMLRPFDFISTVHVFRAAIPHEILNAPSPEKVFIWTTAAWRVPASLLGLLCLYLAYRAHRHPIGRPVGGFRGSITVDALMRYQAQVHSPIAPIVPIAKTLHKNLDPRFHEAYHPHEAVEKFKLTNKNGELDIARTEQYFLKQLGTRIYRPAVDEPNIVFADRFNDYEKAIFAMLAPLAIKIKDGLGEYQVLCDALNYSAVNPTQTPDLRLANDLYKQYRDHPKLNNLFKRHHFSTTYLMQLYMLAKRAGKISTSHWVGWLRPNANSLYAALNGAGRSVAFTEVAGAYCHWKFELRCYKEGYMPVRPCVVGATKALEDEWNFWVTADQRETEESLWGRMTEEQNRLDQDLFRKSVTDVLSTGLIAPAVAGTDSLFDQEEAAARRKQEDEQLTALMAGVRANLPKQEVEEE